MGLAGTVLGILGLVAGYWFYRATLSIPALSLLDAGSHPRLINVAALGGSPIKLVRRDGTEVGKNVYLARLYLWNSGNVPLRRGDILRPLVLSAGRAEILDPKVAVATRPDITGFSIALKAGSGLSVDFTLLEPGDGCAMNVLYASGQPVAFSLEGAVLGVKSFAVSDTIPTGDLVMKVVKQVFATLGVLAIIGVVVGLAGFLAGALDTALSKTTSAALKSAEKIFKRCLLGAFACLVAYAIVEGAKDKVLRDPANFVPAALTADLPQAVPISKGRD